MYSNDIDSIRLRHFCHQQMHRNLYVNKMAKGNIHYANKVNLNERAICIRPKTPKTWRAWIATWILLSLFNEDDQNYDVWKGRSEECQRLYKLWYKQETDSAFEKDSSVPVKDNSEALGPLGEGEGVFFLVFALIYAVGWPNACKGLLSKNSAV